MSTIKELEKEIERLNELQNVNDSNQMAMQGLLDKTAEKLSRIRTIVTAALTEIRKEQK